MSETNSQTPRTILGRVVSTKGDKTISVYIERRVSHPLYGKYIRRSTKLLAHDEENACRDGDVVTIAECRPLSKRKSWRLHEIVERASE
ncbi:small subunit ribosomal protein S17 [Natronospira proteinivora]|uniref:Small ribosomal subunit protein uS17 n=1 Tax=Natronospira proteinivora TaxID=1807133 RepID=A0ABT1GB45_9GAMM|nr:30S ribosomal protein S17 [Natronospira proteinivora]MCP1728514.1 small subunit ribosomal protein S17 [Natronospira proteinivora]